MMNGIAELLREFDRCQYIDQSAKYGFWVIELSGLFIAKSSELTLYNIYTNTVHAVVNFLLHPMLIKSFNSILHD